MLSAESALFFSDVFDIFTGGMGLRSAAHGLVGDIPQFFGRIDLVQRGVGIERPIGVGDDLGLWEEPALLVAVGQHEHGLFHTGKIPERLIVKGTDLGIVGPDMGFGIDDDGIARLKTGLHALQKVSFFLEIAAKGDHTVGLHSKAQSRDGKHIGMTDDKALFGEGGKGADVGVALHLGMIADDKAAVLFCLLQNAAVGKFLMANDLLEHIHHRDHHAVVENKFKCSEDLAGTDVLILLSQRFGMDLQSGKIVIQFVLVIDNPLLGCQCLRLFVFVVFVLYYSILCRKGKNFMKK